MQAFCALQQPRLHQQQAYSGYRQWSRTCIPCWCWARDSQLSVPTSQLDLVWSLFPVLVVESASKHMLKQCCFSAGSKLTKLEPLPDGWKRMLDSESKCYFYLHHASSVTTWLRPSLWQAWKEFCEDGSSAWILYSFGGCVGSSAG